MVINNSIHYWLIWLIILSITWVGYINLSLQNFISHKWNCFPDILLYSFSHGFPETLLANSILLLLHYHMLPHLGSHLQQLGTWYMFHYVLLCIVLRNKNATPLLFQAQSLFSVTHMVIFSLFSCYFGLQYFLFELDPQLLWELSLILLNSD